MTAAEVVAVALTGRSFPPGEISAALRRYREHALAPLFRSTAAETGLPAELLAAIAWRESGFRPDAVNTQSGAAGLMQVMPAEQERYGITGSWSVPAANIGAGGQILLRHYKARGTIYRTLASYSGHATWLRTGGDPKPDLYIAGVMQRVAYLWVAKLTGEI
jgi:soluble lytic murein transglycosylase-like protein